MLACWLHRAQCHGSVTKFKLKDMCTLSTNCQDVLCGTHNAQLKRELGVNVMKPKHWISAVFTKHVFFFFNIYSRSLPKRYQSESSRLNNCHTNCKYLLLNLTRVRLLLNTHQNPEVWCRSWTLCLPAIHSTTSPCDTSMVHNVRFHLVKETLYITYAQHYFVCFFLFSFFSPSLYLYYHIILNFPLLFICLTCLIVVIF